MESEDGGECVEEGGVEGAVRGITGGRDVEVGGCCTVLCNY